jgi:hypothetical protein
MVDLEDAVSEDVANEPIETLAQEETPELDAAEPMICDPVIGFVCPKHSAL